MIVSTAAVALDRVAATIPARKREVPSDALKVEHTASSWKTSPLPQSKGVPRIACRRWCPKSGLNDAALYLRDRHQYLLVRNDPKGGVIFDGYDGQQSWLVRAGVLAETKEGLGAGGIPMPPIMADVTFSDLHKTLERIRVDYTVELLDHPPRFILPRDGMGRVQP